MDIIGKAIIFGDNINTDAIIPSKYLTILNPLDLGKHAMEGLDRNFVNKAKEGVVIVAGKNFGCGSSREQAPIALKFSGVKCVLAGSFARIFYRNAINIGLPVLEEKNIAKNIKEGNDLKINLVEGLIFNLTTNKTIKASKLPKFILQIIKDGGLIENLRKRRGVEFEM